MKEYIVSIKETLVMQVKVKAESAVDLVRQGVER